MTSLILLPGVFQTLISVLLFTAIAIEMSLIIYRVTNDAPASRQIKSTVLMIADAILLIAAATAGDQVMASQYALQHSEAIQSAATQTSSGLASTIQNLPWLIYALMFALTLVHAIHAFRRERQRAKNTLSPNSIRETIDDLPMGMCFANPDGLIVLINKKMQELSGELFGFCPQMLAQLSDAFTSPRNGTLLENGCIRTPEGIIYRFRSYEHIIDGQPGWKQVAAYDVTRQYEVSEELRVENEKLAEINQKLQSMYDRMSDDIREKESLQLKIYVHDTIGRSILTVQDIMNSGKGALQKVQALNEAVSILSGKNAYLEGTMEDVIRTAAKLGVRVNLIGDILAETTIDSLASAATRECVTNCLRHAGGTEVTVTAVDECEHVNISITNNGRKPEGEIVEGSGLSSLRRSVEASGGKMSIASQPEFCLTLMLPRNQGKQRKDIRQ